MSSEEWRPSCALRVVHRKNTVCLNHPRSLLFAPCGFFRSALLPHHVILTLAAVRDPCVWPDRSTTSVGTMTVPVS